MTVAPMRADDLVLAGQGCTDAYRYCFLSNVTMDDTIDLTGLEIVGCPFLKATDGLHAAEHGQLLLCCQLHCSAPFVSQRMR